jgi:hypothetical protein
MAECEVSEEDLRKMLVTTSNVVFHEHTGDKERVLESDLQGEMEKEVASDGTKKRRVMQDLSSVFWMHCESGCGQGRCSTCVSLPLFSSHSFLCFLPVISFSRLPPPPPLPPSLPPPTSSPVFSSSMQPIS